MQCTVSQPTPDLRLLTAPTPTGTPGLPTRLRADQLDGESEALLGVLNLARRGTITHDTLRAQRKGWEISARALGRADAVAEVRNVWIPGPHGDIEARVYRPAAAAADASPAFIWFHGGAFMIGGLTTADAVCRHIARVSGVVVVSVRYRLAPEHDLYAGRADCLAAVEWLAREGHTLGIDGARLAVGGDSAGGNLAAAVSQRCTEQGGPALRLQVLVYPATNLSVEFPSKQENAAGYLLTSDGIDSIHDILRERDADHLADPWVSPALNPQLAGLPPALVLTAGFDPIRDDGLGYTQLLREAAVPVELLHYPGQFHGFVNFDGVLRSARDALERIGTALRAALRPAVGQPAPAVNRTLEITITPALTLPRAGRRLLTGSLMLGERLESWRARATRRLWARSPRGGDWASAPLLNPVTTCRAQVARRLAPIQASETFCGA
jgi:acetyl esterase